MKRYIDGAIKEGIEKAQLLKAKIPRPRELGVFFPPLATTATAELDNIILSLNYLLSDQDYSAEQTVQQKFYQFKQLSGRLSEIENVVIAAISRKTDGDDFVNKLVHAICNEINYPIQVPVASCLSQKYYHIYPYYNLICIPLLESDFLLNIPDIYHELCHPLISIENLKLTPFQNCLGEFNNSIKKYFNAEIKRKELNKFNSNYFESLFVWRDSWIESWSTEFFCDLFSVYTLGPAFAWSNIHMCTKMSWDIYRLSAFKKNSHPPDDARMYAILHGLRLIGFDSEANEISGKWNEFKNIVGISEPQAEYPIALPAALLEEAAEKCLEGTRLIDCCIVNPNSSNRFYTLLNEAWIEFWIDPASFFLKEQQLVKDLRRTL